MPGDEVTIPARANIARTRRTKLAFVPTLPAIASDVRRSPHPPGSAISASACTATEKRVARLIVLQLYRAQAQEASDEFVNAAFAHAEPPCRTSPPPLPRP